MTRDEEIRHDLARQWQELEGGQDDGVATQEIADFLRIAYGMRKRHQPLKQGPSSPPLAKH